MGPFDVEAKHIEMLDDRELTRLLKKLLLLEADAFDIPQSATRVPLDINVPDGGEDGRIRWDGGKKRTDYIPKRFTLFQCKARNTGPQKCYEEVLRKGSRTLKEQVQEVLDRGGAYIIFCKKRSRSIESNVCKIREGLKAAEFADWQGATVDFYDGVRIAGWVNKYFATQIYVRSCTGQSVPFGLKTWEDWAKHENFVQDYIWNDKLREYKEGLRNELGSMGKSVVRVTGLSGLGKTRLVLEVFRGEETTILALRNSVLYFDAAGGDEGLANFIADSRSSDLRAILIIDNCDAGLHERFAREMGYGRHNIKLITIDYDISKVNSGTRRIHITQDDCKGVVRGILKNAYQGLGDFIIGRIEEFAQDFASIAVLLAKQVQQGVDDIGRLSDDQFAKRLLWGRESEDENVTKVIRTCSLFEYIEFSDEEYTNQVNFLSAKIAQVKKDRFSEICCKFLKLGILQKRGRFIRVCPIPLAIRLAAEWWDTTPTNEILRFTEKLNKVGLLERFCEQAKMLHFSKKTRDVVEKFCGPQGPFGNAEVLLCDEGSRLFRALVEVNPQTTVEALNRALWGKSRDELLKVKDHVRRNLVWALENLCWWKGTFARAARLLLRLAAAENETWANNATGQFKQLFQIYLPGTEANLDERLRVAREALDSEVKEERALGVLALGRAIRTGSFSRGGRVESQGSRVPARDYEPTGEEIREYWQECIRLLTGAIIAGGELSPLARQELGMRIRGLLRNGMMDKIEAALKDIVKEEGAYWPEALRSVRDCIDYDGKDIPKEIRERIESLGKMLQPEDLGGKLRSVVSIPDWRDREDENGNYVSISAEEADQLARQFAGDNSWFKEAGTILEGEQRQAYAFGKALARSMPAALQSEFIELCLSVLSKLGREKGNPDVLGAFLGNVSDEDLVDETMERVIQDDRLCGYAVMLTRSLDLTEKRLLKLLPLVRQNKIPVGDIRVFSYGRALDKLPENFVTGFCHEIANHSREGANCALDVLYMYCYQNGERFAKCAPTFRNIIMRKGLLIGEKQSQMAGHNWEVVSNRLLRMDKDIELAEHLAEEMVAMCGSDKIPWNTVRYNAKRVLEVLLKEYFEECWDIIGKALMSEDWRTKHYLENMIGPGYEKEKSEALIAEIPQDGLLKWCKNNLPHGPVAIAQVTPIFSSEKEKTLWHPLARKLIDEFGNIEHLRGHLDSNLWSFSSVGSRAPYYQRRIDLLSELSNHPTKEVREWAASGIKYFEKERDTARREAEEWEWGIH